MTELQGKTIGIVGPGKVGVALGILLEKAGYSVAVVAAKSPAKAREAVAASFPMAHGAENLTEVPPLADTILITTRDEAIAGVAEALAPYLDAHHCLLHTSGATAASVMKPDAEAPWCAGSMHPLQSFASAEEGVALVAGCTFVIEGDYRAAERAWELAEAAGGRPRIIPADDKVMYHAGACIASNFLVTLAAEAVEFLMAAGFERGEALEALLPLMEGTLRNLKSTGLPGALTGPIARGDLVTVQRHLVEMEALEHPGERFYRAMGLRTLRIAQEQGRLPMETLESLKEILTRSNGGG